MKIAIKLKNWFCLSILSSSEIEKYSPYFMFRLVQFITNSHKLPFLIQGEAVKLAILKQSLAISHELLGYDIVEQNGESVPAFSFH
jgi:hypothetical protein